MTAQEQPEWTPTHTLGRQIAAARKAMGEPRWKRLNDEFEQPARDGERRK